PRPSTLPLHAALPILIYLDTAAFGLPPAAVADAVRADVERWAAGEARAPGYDPYVDSARERFARLVGVRTEDVAIGSQVSSHAADRKSTRLNSSHVAI